MLDVLFVCTGNICRSPLAEAFLLDRSRRLLRDPVTARSAGTWGHAGHPAMPDTIAVAATRGLDLDGHAASPLTPDLVEAADLVLGLTRAHREDAVRMVPEARSRAFTLKELVGLLRAVGGGSRPDRQAALDRIAEADQLRRSGKAPAMSDLDVADPIGRGAEFHRAVASEIEEAVDALMLELFGASDRAAAGEG